MAALTRRPNQDRNRESWRILYGDIEVGWIGQRSGIPKDVERWGWHCGFFPLSHRGVRAHGVAPTFEKARNAFEAAWADILPRCSNTDFDEHRFERAHLAWKYRMWDTGCRMPTQAAADRSRCFCGVEITTASISDHIRARHMDEATCLLCEDEGWVCESHPDQPFAGPHACRCGDAGIPCPKCNPSSRDDQPPRLPKGFEPDA